MTIFLIIGCVVGGIAIGRHFFGSWFNHINLYSLVWGGTLVLYESRFINYYDLEIETWMIIAVCWLIFIMGAITVVLMKRNDDPRQKADSFDASPSTMNVDINRLGTVLWILNIITLLSALHDLYLVSKLFGGLAKALIFGNLLYSYRVSEGLPGSIPYMASLVFTAATLAGSYTAQKERITLPAIMPLIVIIMIDFANMGRADILVVAILFTTAYFLTPKPKHTRRERSRAFVRKIVTAVILLSIVVAGAEFIRSSRQAKESIAGSTRALQKLKTASIITPSIYLYFSSDYGVLNQYFRHDREHPPVGGNTFLPLYRIFERIGVEVHADTYQPFYRVPTYTNTGTYLRELHADFGIPGLLLGPYLLGILSSVFWYRLQYHRQYIDLVLAGFFYGIVGLSFFVMPTRISPFLFYLVVSTVVALIIDRKRIDRSVVAPVTPIG